MGRATSNPRRGSEEEEDLDVHEQRVRGRMAAEECEFCGLTVIMQPEEKEACMLQHFSYCPSKKRPPPEQDMEENLTKMTTLNIFRGEQFYFCKVPLDSTNTVFRWRKEAIMPISKGLHHRINSEPFDCRFEEKYVVFRTEIEKRRVNWR
jgi:hypothetical protein